MDEHIALLRRILSLNAIAKDAGDYIDKHINDAPPSLVPAALFLSTKGDIKKSLVSAIKEAKWKINPKETEIKFTSDATKLIEAIGRL